MVHPTHANLIGLLAQKKYQPLRVLCPKPQERILKRTREHTDDMPGPQVTESCTHCSSQAMSVTLVGDAVLSAELTRARSTLPSGRRAVHCSCPLMLCVSPSLRSAKLVSFHHFGTCVRVNQPVAVSCCQLVSTVYVQRAASY